MVVTVNVTQDHIGNGEPSVLCKCMVALALNELPDHLIQAVTP